MLRRDYRHIIWDWNGTLLDDLDLSIEIMNGILARRRLPLLDRARYHTLFDFPVRRYYERLGFDPVRDSFEQLSVEFIGGYDQRRWEARLHVGAAELLSAVVASGRTQSILSAYRHETLCEIVAHFDLTRHFVRLQGLDDIYAHSKIELGRSSLAALAVPPGDVLLVGDTLHDFEVAEALGVDCVLIAGGHHPASRLRERTPQVFPDLPALAAALAIPLPTLTPSAARSSAAVVSNPENPAG